MPKKSAAPSGKVKVRILIDCAAGRCNTVVEVDAEAARDLVANGEADDTPAAVAYVESL